MAKNQELKQIIENLKKTYNLNQAQIADKLGVHKQYLSDVLNERKKFSDELRRKINRTFNLAESTKPAESYTRGRPYYDVDFLGGFDLVANDQTRTPDYLIDFEPLNREGVMWCNVTGHSMEPQISHGDIIAIKEVYDWNTYINYGEVYAIVTRNELRTIKIVRAGRDERHYRLVPINTEEYDEQQVDKAQILHVFAVLGSFKRF